MTSTEAMSTNASLRLAESDFEVSSSYVPSLASPTNRDSIDEGYDPDETLKITVYDNEEIKIKSRGMYYTPSNGDSDDDDDQDVEFYEQGPNLNQLRNFIEATDISDDDDDQDVIFVSSQELSRNDIESPADVNANSLIINQLRDSYEDEQDVEHHPALMPMVILAEDEEVEEEIIDAFDQFDSDYLIEIEPNKFSMVRDEEGSGTIEVLEIKHQVDYGELDQSASFDSNVKVCTEILKGINFDEVSLASIQRLRAKSKKLQRMSKITSLDSDTKVFKEIWNAVKHDKFDSKPNSLDSDTKVFKTLTSQVSATIPEEEPSACPSSAESWDLPENPGSSPVYYPDSAAVMAQLSAEQELELIEEKMMMTKMAETLAQKSITALREHCSSRIEQCACQPQLISEKDRTGKSALHYCAENQNLTCIEQILCADPNLLNETDEEGYTPLHLAVISGNAVIVKFLISKGANVDAVDNEKHSAVHWATVCGEIQVLDILIKAGANPNTPDIHGAFPLHYAAQMCGPNSEMGHDSKVGLTVLRKLLSHEVNVSAVDHDGRQPLMWAASAGSSDAILSLVNAGASVESIDKDSLTALHCAASRGHHDCVETLVGLCGSEVDVTDQNGSTPLFYAVTLGHPQCASLLLGFGANANKQDRKGRTPAHCGAAKGQLEAVKILAFNGADLWVPNIRGDLPLHEAVHSGKKDLVRWILSQKPECINASNNDGKCPLHIAALGNNVEMCKLLIDNQALVNSIMRNSKGHLMTPLDAALYRGNRGCAKYIQLHGGLPASKLTNKSALQKALERALTDNKTYLQETSSKQVSLVKVVSEEEEQQQISVEIHKAEEEEEKVISKIASTTATQVFSIFTQTDQEPEPEPVELEARETQTSQAELENKEVMTDPIEEEEEKPVEPQGEPDQKPSEHDFEPADPDVEPLEPEVEQMEPEAEPVEPEVEPVEPDVNPEEPDVNPVEPEVNPEEPEVNPVEPEVNPVEPEVNPVEPEVDLIEPEVEPVEPEAEQVEPNGKLVESDEPMAAPAEPDPKPIQKPVEHTQKPTEHIQTLVEPSMKPVNPQYFPPEPLPERCQTRTLMRENEDFQVPKMDKMGSSEEPSSQLVPESESDFTFKDSGIGGDYLGLAEESSRSFSSPLLKAITDGLQPPIDDLKMMRIAEKPELISSNLPPDFGAEARNGDIDRLAYVSGGREMERPHTSGEEAPSVAIHVQNSLRKFQMERKIFEELLELKRLQIRAGRANEQLMVKRLSDSYSKTVQSLAGLRNYDGPFTFKEFEKYLYSQLRSTQYGRRPRSMPGLLSSSNNRQFSREVQVMIESKSRKSSHRNQLRHINEASAYYPLKPPRFEHGPQAEELERLASALKKHGIDCAPLHRAYEAAFRGSCSHDASDCTNITHRCHHATHAYTGVPCVPKKKAIQGRNVVLPKIDNGRNHSKKAGKRRERPKFTEEEPLTSQSTFDPSTPLTLELKHGSQLHKVKLPTENLDKSKKYYVTFTINQRKNSVFNDRAEKIQFKQQQGQNVIPQIESR